MRSRCSSDGRWRNAIPDQGPDRDEITFVAASGGDHQHRGGVSRSFLKSDLDPWHWILLSKSPVQKSCVAISDALPAAQFSETPSRTVGILVQQNSMNN